MKLIENDFGAEIGVTLTGFLKNTLLNASTEVNYLTMTWSINESNETTKYLFIESNESRSTLLKFRTDSLERPLIMNLDFLTTRYDFSPIELSLDAFIIDSDTGAILAGTILLSLNIIIVFEVSSVLCVLWKINSCARIFASVFAPYFSGVIGCFHIYRSLNSTQRSSNNE